MKTKEYFALSFVLVCIVIYMKACWPTAINVDFNKILQEENIIPKYSSTSRLTFFVKGQIDGTVTLFTGTTKWEDTSKAENINYFKGHQLTKGKIDTTFHIDWYYHPGKLKIVSENCSENSQLKIKYVFAHAFF